MLQMTVAMQMKGLRSRISYGTGCKGRCYEKPKLVTKKKLHSFLCAKFI